MEGGGREGDGVREKRKERGIGGFQTYFLDSPGGRKEISFYIRIKGRPHETPYQLDGLHDANEELGRERGSEGGTEGRAGGDAPLRYHHTAKTGLKAQKMLDSHIHRRENGGMCHLYG